VDDRVRSNRSGNTMVRRKQKRKSNSSNISQSQNLSNLNQISTRSPNENEDDTDDEHPNHPHPSHHASNLPKSNLCPRMKSSPTIYYKVVPLFLLAVVLFVGIDGCRGEVKKESVVTTAIDVDSNGNAAVLSTTMDIDESSTSSTKHQRVVNPVGQSFSPGNFEVLEVLPHNPAAFTQGLTYYDGYLYEGTGMYGESQLHKLHPSNPSLPLSDPPPTKLLNRYFGEGITYYSSGDDDDDGHRPLIIQLTWREKTGFIYDARTLKKIRKFSYTSTTNEGWGITYDKVRKEFVVSDGSEYLHFWDRDTLEERRRVKVMMKRGGADAPLMPVTYLNELEFMPRGVGGRGRRRGNDERDDDEGNNKGESTSSSTILANVWFQDFLLEIDPSSGLVVKLYNFETLYENRMKGADFFNGVSISSNKEEEDSIVYVTGKYWPHLFKVRLL